MWTRKKPRWSSPAPFTTVQLRERCDDILDWKLNFFNVADMSPPISCRRVKKSSPGANHHPNPRSAGGQFAVMPPSITSSEPVTHEASSEAK
jgi:hypothetical protein